jgi:hypothetical protein
MGMILCMVKKLFLHHRQEMNETKYDENRACAKEVDQTPANCVYQIRKRKCTMSNIIVFIQ